MQLSRRGINAGRGQATRCRRNVVGRLRGVTPALWLLRARLPGLSKAVDEKNRTTEIDPWTNNVLGAVLGKEGSR
jgi:hypothetical protein